MCGDYKPDVLERNRLAQKGRKKSDLEIQHLREAFQRPETKEKMSKAHSGANNAKFAGEINQYTKDLQYIRTFLSLKDVHNSLNLSIGNVSAVCRSERPFAGGFIWRYAKDCDPITHMPKDRVDV